MDNEPMKKCKHCQTDIPVKAKVCPNCKKKQGKPMGCLIAIIAVVVIGIAGASAGSKGSGDSSSEAASSQGAVKINKGDASTTDKSSSSNDDASADNNSDESSAAENNNIVEVGDSFEASGLKISFTDCNLDFKVKDDKYDLYKPAEGKKFISLSFKFENTSDKDEYVSVYDFDCYADNETCDQKYFSQESDFINTNLSKGRNVSFTAFFEVPENAKVIELEYEPDFWSDEKVIIKVK